MTLIEYKNERFGITNYHVIDEFRQRLKSEPNLRFGIGNIDLCLEDTLFDESEDLDLCVLYLDGYKKEDFASYGNVSTEFFQVDNFDIGNVKQGSYVLSGGFPGEWRKRPETNHLVFDTLSSSNMELTEVTDRNLRFELILPECTYIREHNQEDFPESLGGLSGGPIFYHQISDVGISSFKLVGIIYEHMEEADSILARPISFLDENLWIKWR